MKSLKEIENKIRQIAKEMYGSEVDIKSMDSIRFIELIVKVEDEFDIEIDIEDMSVELLNSYEEIAQFVIDQGDL